MLCHEAADGKGKACWRAVASAVCACLTKGDERTGDLSDCGCGLGGGSSWRGEDAAVRGEEVVLLLQLPVLLLDDGLVLVETKAGQSVGCTFIMAGSLRVCTMALARYAIPSAMETPASEMAG